MQKIGKMTFGQMLKPNQALPFYPGVAYFVAFAPSDICNVETILRTLHEQETEADVCQLRTNLKPFSDETRLPKNY